MRPGSALPWRRVAACLFVLDAVMVALGVALSYQVRYHMALPGLLEPRTEASMLAGIGLALSWMLMLGLAGLYRRRHLVSGLMEYERVWTAGALTSLFVIVVLYLRTRPYVSRGFIFISLVVVAMLVCVGRLLARRVIYRLGNRGHVLERVLVIGTNRQAVAVARELMNAPSASSEVVGFLSEYIPVGAVVMQDLRVLGEPLCVEEIALSTNATTALIVESGLSWESLQGLVRTMHRTSGISFALIPGLFDLHSTPMTPRQLGPVMALAPHATRVTGTEAVMKRMFDLVLSAVALVVLLPVAVAIASASTPAKRRFVVDRSYFRPAAHPLRVWRFTSERAASFHLARLPELIQVLAGRMSLIGPRPIPAANVEAYGRSLAFLEAAKPGVIGPWWLAQDSGTRRTSADEVELDLSYLRNYSLWLDLQILVSCLRMTLPSRPRAHETIEEYPGPSRG